MDVAYWMLVIVAGFFLATTIYFAALTSEYRARFYMFPPRWAGGLSRQITELREIIVSDQEYLNEVVRLAVEDLEDIKQQLLNHPAAASLDFSGLDALAKALDDLAKADDAPVADEAPVEEAPVEEAPVEEV